MGTITHTFFFSLGLASRSITSFTATFSDLQVPGNMISRLPIRGERSRPVIVTSPSSVYEAGNIPHDPHRDRRRRIMRRRNLGSPFSSLINYKEVDRLQLLGQLPRLVCVPHPKNQPPPLLPDPLVLRGFRVSCPRGTALPLGGTV